MSQQGRKGFVNLLLEFSIPLLAGVAVALIAANAAPHWYHEAIHWMPFGEVSVLGHELTLHVLVNDFFMVLFFGIAAKEITESLLPGGALSPMSKAVNPLLATLGGVLGPVGVFFLGLHFYYPTGIFGSANEWSALQRGWGVPTATDIALAWLVARTVFGKGHPAVNFLLLLAVADDAIGLGIIAVFYGDPTQPAQPQFLLLVLAGMAMAFAMRKIGLKSWVPYIVVGGSISWTGLVLTHLHPALALVFIVPFLPGPKRDFGMFRDEDEVDKMGESLAQDLHVVHSPLHQFEHQLKSFVDVGLFLFAFTNAGVELAAVGPMTWLILGSLVIGKTLGVTLLGSLAVLLGFPLPNRMGFRELVMAGFVAALGLTVALFVAGAAFIDPQLLGQAKMGALFSGFAGLVAIAVGRAVGMGKSTRIEGEGSTSPDPAQASNS